MCSLLVNGSSEVYGSQVRLSASDPEPEQLSKALYFSEARLWSVDTEGNPKSNSSSWKSSGLWYHQRSFVVPVFMSGGCSLVTIEEV